MRGRYIISFLEESAEIGSWCSSRCKESEYGSLAIIFICAGLGKTSVLKNVSSKYALNMFNKEGETPFDVALYNHQYFAAYTIQVAGGKRSFKVNEMEKINPESTYLNDLALYRAVLAGNLEAVRRHYDRFSTNAGDLLALSCHVNQPAIMRFLAEECRADVHYTLNSGQTILDVAYANQDIISYLKAKKVRSSYAISLM